MRGVGMGWSGSAGDHFIRRRLKVHSASRQAGRQAHTHTDWHTISELLEEGRRQAGRQCMASGLK